MIAFTHPEQAGFLPSFFSENDPRPAREQADTAYAHGGGWRPMKKWKLGAINEGPYTLAYPGDDHVKELSRGKLRDETIVLFDHSWVAIIQPDGIFEVARMD